MFLKKIILSTLLIATAAFPALAETKISVLPFDVLSQKEDIKQFGIGTMDTITNALGNIPEFIMIDRGQLNAVLKELAFQQSVFINEKDTEKIGKLLGADVLVLGSIQAFENKFRISAHFTEVKSGKILKTIQVTGSDIFALQDQLASELISQQQVKVTPDQQQRITSITKATDDITAYDYYIKGRTEYLLYTDKGYQKAIEFFNQALAKDPEYTLALAAKAEAQASVANEFRISGLDYNDLLKQSEENALAALKQNKNLAEIHRALCNVYSMQLNFEEAKKEAEIALKLNPNDAESYTLLWFNNSMINGKFNSNDPLIIKSMEINPRLVLSHDLKAMAYINEKKYQEAIAEAELVIKLSPDFMYSYYILGLTNVMLNNFEEAGKNYRKAINLSPKNSMARLGMTNVYIKDNQPELAEKEAREVIKLFPKHSEAHYILSTVLMMQGKTSEAESEMKVAVGIYPDYIKVDYTNFQFGLIYLKQGKLEEALVSLNKAYEANINNTELNLVTPEIIIKNINKVLLKLGTKLYQQGKYEQAINNFNQILKTDAKNAEVYLNLGAAYYSNGNLDDSARNYLKAIEINNGNPDSHYNLAITYSALGKQDLAKSEYGKACKLGMKNACL